APLYNNGAKADYSYQDATPLFTDCYYRIKAVSQSGLIQYSAKVKVEALNLPPLISVYPNPVINREMNLVFINKPKGIYDIKITNNLGQVMYTGEVVVSTIIDNKKISLVNLKTAGIYQLAISAQDGSTNSLRQILVK
ncbi:MAG: T9SS type A sorting domain-containing protein, partial [Deinococcales bacterium]|nr:T9SS type A sorting domain-containing protein [Chitinophagaceae bacterium]